MKKVLLLIIVFILIFSGCSTSTSTIQNKPSQSTSGDSSKTISQKYEIGDEVVLGSVMFNIYKIDDENNEIHLLAQRNITTTTFSEVERDSKYQHDYEGSLVESYVNRFVDDLEDMGYDIESSGIIDKDDLYELGFKHSENISGRPYRCDTTPEFVKYEEKYWVTGYCKYDTRSWAYSYETLDVNSCDEEFGVRPVICIKEKEIDKKVKESNSNVSIKEIVNSSDIWISEGDIHNPYDTFYFDCEKMIFKNSFESPKMTDSSEYSMEFIDDKTIYVDGVMRYYEYPAELTVVSQDKLRIRFIDDVHNDGDNFLVKKKKND